MFRAGDVVQRKSDGVKFVLAIDEWNGRIVPAGWPSSWEDASDFGLLEAASDEDRKAMLYRVATGNHQFRRYARSDYLKGSYEVFREDSPGYFRLGEVFENPAGKILNIYEGQAVMHQLGAGGVAIIESRKGTIRSNHWHRTDAHILYVLRGAMLYFELDHVPSPGDLGTPPKPYLVHEGSAVLTTERRLHATAFERDTTLLSISRLSRTHESHEGDVVRVPWLNPEHMKTLIPWIDWK